MTQENKITLKDVREIQEAIIIGGITQSKGILIFCTICRMVNKTPKIIHSFSPSQFQCCCGENSGSRIVIHLPCTSDTQSLDTLPSPVMLYCLCPGLNFVSRKLVQGSRHQVPPDFSHAVYSSAPDGDAVRCGWRLPAFIPFPYLLTKHLFHYESYPNR